jgi:pyruvate/2-oxoglutarate/acetoin dehydrogenase E1 component
MGQSVREVIREITKKHLLEGNELFGQCLSAVGWVGNTIPSDAPNLVELSMADVMAGGIVVGSALVGKRPIFVARYQGFQWFNAPIICNYAGKSKEMWGIGCPILIRSIAMEGSIGPVAGSSHHGIYYRMPGIKICSPMTPDEYRLAYESFMLEDSPLYVSEHRKSYDNTEELKDIAYGNADFVLFPFSVTRFEAIKASKKLYDEEGIKVSVFHQFWINPLKISHLAKNNLRFSKYGGVVIDDDYPNGIAKQVAYELMLESEKRVHVLAIEEKTAGFQLSQDNLPPDSDKICEFVKDKIRHINLS